MGAVGGGGPGSPSRRRQPLGGLCRLAEQRASQSEGGRTLGEARGRPRGRALPGTPSVRHQTGFRSRVSPVLLGCFLPKPKQDAGLRQEMAVGVAGAGQRHQHVQSTLGDGVRGSWVGRDTAAWPPLCSAPVCTLCLPSEARQAWRGEW